MESETLPDLVQQSGFPSSGQRVILGLLEGGLIDRADFVAGGLRVSDASSRNCNYRVEVPSAQPVAFFVKAGPADASRSLLAREARVYEWWHLRSTGQAALLPALHAYLPASGLLVLELLSNARPLTEAFSRSGLPPSGTVRRLARELARLTALPLDDLAVGPPAPPEVLGSSLEVDPRTSGGVQELCEIISTRPEIYDVLARLRKAWRPTVFMHGDLRWSNVMLRERGSILVDFELAGPGDTNWDPACVVAEFLHDWLFAMQSTGRAQPSVDDSLIPFQAVRSRIRLFWTAYVRQLTHVGGPAADHEQMLRYAAARLLQRTLESLQYRDSLSTQAVFACQFAENVLRDPARAAAHLELSGRAT